MEQSGTSSSEDANSESSISLQPGSVLPSEKQKLGILKLAAEKNPKLREENEKYLEEVIGNFTKRLKENREEEKTTMEDKREEARRRAEERRKLKKEMENEEVKMLKETLRESERLRKEEELKFQKFLEYKDSENQALRDLLLVRTNLLEEAREKVTNIHSSTAQNVYVNPNVLDMSIISQNNLMLNSNLSNKLAESLDSLKDTIESSKCNNDSSVSRKYILNSKSDINIWLDKLNSELSSKDLLDVIDPNISEPPNLNENMWLKRKEVVKNIIKNRIYYYKEIMHILEPKEMFSKIRENIRIESNVTHTSVRKRLYQLQMSKSESVAMFCRKLDDIITEYESCEGAIQLSDEEKRSAFYEAVVTAVPEITSHSISYQQSNKRNITIEEIKRFLLQIEAQRKALGEKESKEGREKRITRKSLLEENLQRSWRKSK